MVKKLPVLTREELLKKLQKGQYVLKFMADWCPDCNFLKPHLPEIEADFPQYQFLQVDRDHNLELFKELDVFGIPSFIVFQDGQETGRLVNKARKSKEDVEAFLQQFN